MRTTPHHLGMWPWQRTVDPEELVHLVVPGIGTYVTVVERAVPGAAHLRIIGPPDARVPTRYLHTRRCTATPARDDGARTEHIDGHLHAVVGRDGAVADDRIDLVFTRIRVAPSGTVGAAAYAAASASADLPAHPQRRFARRVLDRRPVTVVPERFARGWLEGETHDISSGGALISGAERLREGERLRVLLELDPETLLDAQGHIVRFDDARRAGVRLDALNDRDRALLEGYVGRRQREALQALRDRTPAGS